MCRISKIVALILLLLFVGACTKERVEPPAKPKAADQSDAVTEKETSTSGTAGMLADKKLANFPAATIGEAFDRYRFLAKKEWRVQQSPNNKNIYIDFSGWFDSSSVDTTAAKAGVTALGVEVKFVVYPDGSFRAAMVSKLEMKTDGKRYAYPYEDLNGILARIYANKEIRF